MSNKYFISVLKYYMKFGFFRKLVSSIYLVCIIYLLRLVSCVKMESYK